MNNLVTDVNDSFRIPQHFKQVEKFFGHLLKEHGINYINQTEML
jgi:rRNA pseudouridine-1189 N-methylase Emg1 (Nep1/Mra1 family)